MIFVDTWAWVALADRSDQHASTAAQAYSQLAAGHEVFVTSNYIVSETLTHLSARLGVPTAMRFVDAVIKKLQQSERGLIHADASIFEKALEYRRRYVDKPDISFVDLTSMAIMQELSIQQIFTGDRHFEHVGLGFRLVPENP